MPSPSEYKVRLLPPVTLMGTVLPTLVRLRLTLPSPVLTIEDTDPAFVKRPARFTVSNGFTTFSDKIPELSVGVIEPFRVMVEELVPVSLSKFGLKS